jgi:ribosomal protein S18 acetylase RimI-like enzyme
MRIDFSGAAQSDTDRGGDRGDDGSVTVRRSDGTDADLHVAHRVDEDSFREHYGQVPRTFETFKERFDDRGPGWSSLWLAEFDGHPAGLLIGTKQFLDDENAGYVRTLGVQPDYRGRGIGRLLLQAYFTAARAEGREAVLLHVDVANVTNALALYESVGMRPVLQIDAWTKRTTVGRLADAHE